MTRSISFFDTVSDLRKLTGLSGDNFNQALWEAGFDLDDWDFGIVSKKPLRGGWLKGEKGRYFEHWMLDRMEGHCCGYKHVEYGGKHYYMVYHS